jgi:hypothetical protein
MPKIDVLEPLSRRRLLALGGGGLAGGLAASAASPFAATALARAPRARYHQHGRLPVKQIEAVIGADGTVSKGVLGISIERPDLGVVTGPQGVVFPPPFELHGDLTFQPLQGGKAFFNGDLALKPDEIDAVIDAILRNGLTFQAFHQHFYDITPEVWFIHLRGLGSPIGLAHAVRNVLAATATPLPQQMPTNPPTPLDSKRLGRILRGDAQVGGDGVVTVSVGRTDTIVIGEVEAAAEANISTSVEFLPLAADGSRAAAVPDFAMTAGEITPVMREMRSQGWDIGCLYNQESAEQPQLYFSHQFKTGDPYTLAAEVRRGLDRTRTK